MSTPLLLVAAALPAFQSSIVPLDDLDGDGVSDLAIAERGWGADGPYGENWGILPHPERPWPREDPPLRHVWVLSGASGALLCTVPSPTDEEFGRIMAPVGDLDGDGKGELAIRCGRNVWIYTVPEGVPLDRLASPLGGVLFGTSIAGGRDVDGDGVPDILVGQSPGPSVGDRASGFGPGLACLYSGKGRELLAVYGCVPLDGMRQGRRLPYHELGGSRLGTAMALVGDRNGDGRAEVGLTFLGPGQGPVGPAQCFLELRSGQDRLLRARLPASIGRVTASNLPGGPDGLIDAGDLDEDGHPDLIAAISTKYVVAVSGADGNLLFEVGLSEGDWLGGQTACIGVLPGRAEDGSSAWFVATNPVECEPGEVVLRSGRDGSPIVRLRMPLYEDWGDEWDCGPGVDACSPGDLDGDGIEDLAVHLPRLRQVRMLSGVDLSEICLVSTVALPRADPR